MYGWEGRSFDDIARLCVRRDPLKYPLGVATSGTAASGDRLQVLQWFRNLPELSAFLWRMEPQRWGVRLGELTALKSATEAVFIRLDTLGFSEDVRLSHNAITEPEFRVDWWGSYSQLEQSEEDWPRAARTAFRRRSSSDAAQPITEEERAEFVNFLRSSFQPRD